MNNRVVVVGSYNVDLTITTDRIPKSGETVLGSEINYSHGGKGANQAIAASRAGAAVTFIARVGRDTYGERAILDLGREGINISAISIDDEVPSGLASITLDKNGENCIVVVPGANARLSLQDISVNEHSIKESDVLLVQLESPLDAVTAAIERAVYHEVKVILNPAPAQELDSDLLQKVSIITPNRSEAELLTGVTITDANSMQYAAAALHDIGIETVFITLGSEGVFVSNQTRWEIFPAFNVEVKDTVGAGDVFNGVLAAHYQDNESLDEAVSMAIAAASLSVTKFGAQAGIPTHDTIKNFITEKRFIEPV